MYFPTSTARVLSTVPALPNIPPEPVITLQAGPRKYLFCTLTRNGIAVWAVRVGALEFNYVLLCPNAYALGSLPLYWPSYPAPLPRLLTMERT